VAKLPGKKGTKTLEIRRTLGNIWNGIRDKFPVISIPQGQELQPDDLVELSLRIPYKALKHIEALGKRTVGGEAEVMRQATILYSTSREMLEGGAEIYFKTPQGFEPFNPGFTQSWRARFIIIQGGGT